MAQVWGKPTADAIGRPFPDCARCRLEGSEELRELWGCDASSERPVFQVGCSACHGADYACPSCEGRGTIDLYRCPTGFLSAAGILTRNKIDLLMRAYHHYDSRHVLPAEGGWLDQTRSFVLGVEIIDAEKGRLERLRTDKEHRDAEAAKRRANQAQLGSRRR